MAYKVSLKNQLVPCIDQNWTLELKILFILLHLRYSARVPPRSFIHVEDFKTPKDLANYLLFLDRNDTAYREYLSWRSEYEIQNPSQSGFCQMCQRLHTIQGEKTICQLQVYFCSFIEVLPQSIQYLPLVWWPLLRINVHWDNCNIPNPATIKLSDVYCNVFLRLSLSCFQLVFKSFIWRSKT